MEEELNDGSSKNKKNLSRNEKILKTVFNKSVGQQNVKNPFRKSAKATNNIFNIDFEESQGDTTTADFLSQNSYQNEPNIFRKSKNLKENKKNVNDFYSVDFEESKDASSQCALSVPEVSSQNLNETFNEGTTINFKKPKLFKNPKLQSNYGFDIDLEDSHQVLSETEQNSQASSTFSQKSIGTLSQGDPEKPLLFQCPKKHVGNTFEVNFEECDQETVGNLQTPQNSNNSECNKENVEDASVNFEKSLPFRGGNQFQLNDPFNVDFEESQNATDVFTTSGTTPTKTKVLPFRKSNRSTKENDFDVSFKENSLDSNVDGLTANSVTGHARNTTSSSMVDSFATEANVANTTAASTDLNQSSFNDENLRQWMSDHSEDEIEMETSGQKTLPTIPAPPDFETEEDHVRRMELKLKEIIENARKGKCEEKSSVVLRSKVEEKPKTVENKRKISSKPNLRKPAPFVTKRLYDYITKKIRPKYGIDSVLQAEELIISICEVVKIVMRRKNYQKKLIKDLKMEMAKMGVIETTFQFYDFVREFLPYQFRLKVVPCIQPGTNIVYPPEDAINPFQKIL